METKIPLRIRHQEEKKNGSIFNFRFYVANAVQHFRAADLMQPPSLECNANVILFCFRVPNATRDWLPSATRSDGAQQLERPAKGKQCNVIERFYSLATESRE